MNANELAEDLEGAKLVILKLNEMLRQQQAEIDNLAIVKYLNGVTISKLYSEIEALKAENRVLRKGELWLGMVYNNRGNGIAPMYLENFMHFCETTGFTEESGYKLFKAQEK